MRDLRFTFGIADCFNFTFSFQLGASPPEHPEHVAHEESTVNAGDRPATQLCGPIPPTKPEKQASPEAQPADPISITSGSESVTKQIASRDLDRSFDVPVASDFPPSSAEGSAIHDLIRLLPRTSRYLRVPFTSRRRRKIRYRTLLSSRQQQFLNKFCTTLPPEPLPNKPTIEPLPTPPESSAPSTPCSPPLSFQTLPLEIKNMIYRELLVSAKPIKKPHRLVCNERNVMLDSVQPVKDIDGTILRVCRSIYDEALPVLYGQNTFEFAKPRKLLDFSHGCLDRGLLQFGFRESQAGRFTLIRSVILRLGHDRKPYPYMRPPGAPAAPPDRKRIWSHWHQYFFNEKGSLHRYDSMLFPPVKNDFPALDKIELDFTEWQLGEADAIRVEPFIAKLGWSGGLGAVVIRGVKNTKNLEQLREGLVKPGGTFTAIF
ncbi:MAG: hypothetical protein Q9170_000418 [Blastenia crenularia]